MKINVDKNEFADIIMVYLLERIQEKNTEEYPKEFETILNDMKLKGLEAKLKKYWFNVDIITRNKYKFIKKIFNDTASSKSIIEISPREKE